jgi:ribosomal protein S18 acetylase RimI-like enzyme
MRTAMEIAIRALGPADHEVLRHVAEDVFDHEVNPDLAREFLEDARHHIVVAIDGGLVIGFVSAVHYVHPDKRPQLWINEVSVAPTHRQRGLAKAMLRVMLDVGRAHQCTEAWVLTDRMNPTAMALYASAGGREGADGESLNEALVGYSFDL